jgi:hypothetical protein
MRWGPTMTSPPQLDEVRFVHAPPQYRESGLYGWLTFEFNGSVVLDGVTLRRTADGRYCIGYPARRDGRGRDHHFVRPFDATARAAIEAQILSDLRRQGRLAP